MILGTGYSTPERNDRAVSRIRELSSLSPEFQVLTKGRIVEREAAQKRLTTGDTTIDRDRLRHLIMEALDGPFSISNASKDRQSQKAWARYLRQLHQADKAYVRRFLDDEPLTPAEVKQFSEVVAATMRDAVLQIRQGSGAPAQKRRNRAAENGPEQEERAGWSRPASS
jgi:hypothetical protein